MLWFSSSLPRSITNNARRLAASLFALCSSRLSSIFSFMAAPVMLNIRDGWGINPGGKAQAKENGDATLLARTPFHDQLYRSYPGSKLSASGADVGLPEGQMGNSEVGHLNLGAGRIVVQDLTRINKAIAAGELERNKVAQIGRAH